MENKNFTASFICELCDANFYNHREYLKHKRILHQDRIHMNSERHYECDYCSEISTDIISHLRRCKSIVDPYKCIQCDKCFLTKNGLIKHKIKEIRQIGYGNDNLLPTLSPDSKFKLSKQAFKNFLQQYELYPDETLLDAAQLFINYREDIIQLIHQIFERMRSIKIQFCLQVSFVRTVGDISTYTTSYFLTKNYVLSPYINLNNVLNQAINNIDNQINTFENMGSGWQILEIDRLDIRIGVYVPIRGGCEGHELPPEIISKKAIISV